MLEILVILLGYAIEIGILYLIYQYVFKPIAKKQGWI